MALPSTPTAAPAPVPGRTDRAALAAGAVLAAAVILAYSRTFSVPPLFDDGTSIAGNLTLRHLATAFWPPAGATVSGRPVLNLSFALNYALSGTDAGSYHAVNLAIHILAGLTLFGIVRRTVLLRAPAQASGTAFAVAVLWALHPLLTESVTYLVQRAESLMGLFYLLTLYCFIRAAGAAGAARNLWNALCISACLLGMGTKEVMVTAPLVVLLYDRTFIAGTLGGALRARGRVYAGLAATWIALVVLVLAAHGRAGSAGFGSGIPWWSYALLQLPAIVRYLGLCLWPHPLVFDYGAAAAPQYAQVALCGIAVAGLVAATLWALARKPVPGFLGASFFIVLAPSSSIVPVATEAMAEHRMYLALIPVVVMAVAALRRVLGNAAVPACAVLAGILCVATLERNKAYQSEEAIWADTVLKRPRNARAQDNLGFVLSKIPGRSDEAIAHYEEAIRLKPDFVEAHYNLAYALLGVPGRLGDAISQYEEALRLKPDLVMVRFNLARALQAFPGRADEAVAQYEETIRRRSDFAEAHYNLGVMLQEVPGRLNEAIAQYRETLRLKPGDAGAHFSLGTALQASPGSLDEAVAQYEEAIRLAPDFARAHLNLGTALEMVPGRSGDAVAQYGEALRLEPANAEAQFDLGCILQGMPGRMDDAIAHYKEALRLAPGNVAALCNLGNALSSEGRTAEAIAQYAEASRLRPNDATIQLNFAVILLKAPGRTAEAVGHLREAVRLQPGNQAALDILARLNVAPQ
jgi:protein O-mannosyl-transferase